MIVRITAVLCCLALYACGSAEVVTPQPLFVVDTYPSNGAVVSSGQIPVVLTFSAPVDESTLQDALLLEETSVSGTPIRVIPTALAEYLQDSLTATYQLPELPPGTAYSLTVHQDTLLSQDGTTLLTDLVRRFRTQEP